MNELTILPEHSQRSDEFDPWGVHGDQDHAVLSMSDIHPENKQNVTMQVCSKLVLGVIYAGVVDP